MKIAILNYGAGNVKSVYFAIEKLGYKPIITNNLDEILHADKVIFPGVGQASFAMNELKKTELDVIIPTLKQPVLGICLGMQLLCKHSEEGDTNGLGIFDIPVKKFDSSQKVPQMGWNTIYDLKGNLFQNINPQEYVYMVHSYYVPTFSGTIATTNYGLEYSSAIEKDNFFGTQFHPEKSGIIGQNILSNFLKL